MSSFTTYSDSRNIEHLFRQQSGKMFSVLISLFGFDNSEIIEDILQDTFLTAMKTWSTKGVPENPEGWLMQVAKNKLINELKKRSNRMRLNQEFANEAIEEKVEELFVDQKIKDSQLRALFTCCHPALKKKEQIMLTLKVLSGFSDTEIANALLSSKEAVKKAIYRAKKTLQEERVEFNLPANVDISDRVETVHTIIYLLFNEGYKQTIGESVINEDLCYEATRLALLLLEVEGEHKANTNALLALIYLSIARFPSRLTNEGEMIDLESQDRSKWEKDLIYAGVSFLKKSQETEKVSKYHLEATIASIHCTAESYDSTNWEAITNCYSHLLSFENNPVVAINKAIALSKWKGSEAGLQLLEELEEGLMKALKPLFYSAKASMLVQQNNEDLAKSYYQVAHDLCKNETEKKFLARKIEECS